MFSLFHYSMSWIGYLWAFLDKMNAPIQLRSASDWGERSRVVFLKLIGPPRNPCQTDRHQPASSFSSTSLLHPFVKAHYYYYVVHVRDLCIQYNHVFLKRLLIFKTLSDSVVFVLQINLKYWSFLYYTKIESILNVVSPSFKEESSIYCKKWLISTLFQSFNFFFQMHSIHSYLDLIYSLHHLDLFWLPCCNLYTVLSTTHYDLNWTGNHKFLLQYYVLLIICLCILYNGWYV